LQRAFGGSTVLVTGGAGFIGSHLTRLLFQAGAIVLVIDNLSTGRRENLRDLPAERVKLICGDIGDPEIVRSAAEKVGTIFHLACLGVRHSIHSPRQNHQVNATATLSLLETAREVRIQRFVHVSSSEVYGNPLYTPMDENHPTFPNTVYAGAKLAGEAYARAYFRTYDFPVVVLRPFNVFGPGAHHQADQGEVIPRFLLNAMTENDLIIFGDGRQTRDFTHVDDIVRGIATAGMTSDLEGETINLGSGVEISINHLAEAVVGLAGAKEPTIRHEASRPGDTRRLCASIEKARRLLSYEPQIHFEQGLRALWEWYAARSPEQLRELQKEIMLRNWLQPEGGSA